MTVEHEGSDWLSAILLAEDAQGRRLLTPTQSEDALAAVVLAAELGPHPAIEPPLAEVLRRFSERIGASEAETSESFEAKVAAYFEAHPIPEKVRTRIARALEAGADPLEAIGQLGNAAEKLLGRADMAKVKEPPGPGPKGPLAYFEAKKKVGD